MRLMSGNHGLGRFGAVVAGVALVLAGQGARAQDRNPAYAAARAAGQVGELPTGYLGVAVAPTPSLQRMVDDLNIRRKAIYSERAVAQKSTIEDYAFVNACLLIKQTVVGEKYMDPEGHWQTRTAAAPLRSPRCPAE
jgi:uncharacterized protein YdbL (DUF1318 family)